MHGADRRACRTREPAVGVPLFACDAAGTAAASPLVLVVPGVMPSCRACSWGVAAWIGLLCRRAHRGMRLSVGLETDTLTENEMEMYHVVL